MSKRRLMSLNELIQCVENALDCCGIEIDVWETDADKWSDPQRTDLSSDSLHRLTKCLRSHGVLDEYTSRPVTP